jgi:hypothetical protein
MTPKNGRDRATAWLWIVIGLSMQLGPKFVRNATPHGFGSLISFAGTVVLLAACALYAQSKGRSRNWGLLAVLSFIGVIILVLLPRKNSN